MEIEKEDKCWSCSHSDFNPSNGKLICSATDKERAQSCPFATEQLGTVIKIGTHTKRKEQSQWQLVSNA